MPSDVREHTADLYGKTPVQNRVNRRREIRIGGQLFGKIGNYCIAL